MTETHTVTMLNLNLKLMIEANSCLYQKEHRRSFLYAPANSLVSCLIDMNPSVESKQFHLISSCKSSLLHWVSFRLRRAPFLLLRPLINLVSKMGKFHIFFIASKSKGKTEDKPLGYTELLKNNKYRNDCFIKNQDTFFKQLRTAFLFQAILTYVYFQGTLGSVGLIIVL